MALERTALTRKQTFVCLFASTVAGSRLNLAGNKHHDRDATAALGIAAPVGMKPCISRLGLPGCPISRQKIEIPLLRHTNGA